MSLHGMCITMVLLLFCGVTPLFGDSCIMTHCHLHSIFNAMEKTNCFAFCVSEPESQLLLRGNTSLCEVKDMQSLLKSKI